MSNSRVVRREQCPSCAAKGEDRSGNNLAVYDDGHSFCYAENLYFPAEGAGYTLSDFTYEYLPIRGLTKETLKFYDVLTKVDQDGKPVSIGFKYPNEAFKVRSLDKKDFFWVKNSSGEAGVGLFGRDRFSQGGHKYVTITEGELDALSLHQSIGGPVVSIHGASSAVRDCSADHGWLNSFERIYLAFDNDAAGREALRSVAKLFDPNKIFVVRFTKRKDANDYLQHGESAELKNIWWNSKKYLPDNLESTLKVFEEVIRETPTWGLPYPFPTVNEKTYGIRTGEIVLLTAQEGVGKTEIMHSILYKILKETKDAVGAIFLEEPRRRLLQAIAGLNLKRPVHLPDCGVSEEQVIQSLRDIVVSDDRLYVYSHFGSDDPGVLLDTIRYLVSGRGVRYVLLDHITMAVSGLAGEDERKALDYLSTRLEMMVKELDFSLILVSHVNDEGLTRGSRYISKVVDIRIDATRDLKSPDPSIRNTTNLMVSKNRFSGKTGPAGRLWFDPATYTMVEMFDDSPSIIPNFPDYRGVPKETRPGVYFELGST